MVSENFSQARNRARIVCLYAAFRAAHGTGRLSDVQTFQIAQHERFSLAQRQLRQCCLQRLHRRAALELMERIIADRPGRVRELLLV